MPGSAGTWAPYFSAIWMAGSVLSAGSFVTPSGSRHSGTANAGVAVGAGEGAAIGDAAGVGAACTWVAGTEQPPSRSRHRSRERNLVMGYLFLWEVIPVTNGPVEKKVWPGEAADAVQPYSQLPSFYQRHSRTGRKDFRP